MATSIQCTGLGTLGGGVSVRAGRAGYGVSYGNITAVLVEAIKELQTTVQRLEAQIHNTE